MESRIDFKSGKWPTTVTSHDVIGPYYKKNMNYGLAFDEKRGCKKNMD